MTRRLRAPGTLIGVLRFTVEQRAEKIAFRRGARALSFGELEFAGRRASDALTSGGLRAGHAIAVACADPLDRIVAHVGVLMSGGVPMPLDPECGDELEGWLIGGNVRAVIADAPLLVRAAAAQDSGRWEPTRLYCCNGAPPDGALSWTDTMVIAPRTGERRLSADEPAVRYLTADAGPGDSPHPVSHSHTTCVRSLELLRRAWEWTSADVLHLAPRLHGLYGLQTGVHGTVLTGCTTILPAAGTNDDGDAAPDADADALLAELAHERCTILAATPGQLTGLCGAADRAPETARTVAGSLRRIISGESALPAADAVLVESRFGQPPVDTTVLDESLHDRR